MMRLSTRRMLDRVFSVTAFSAIALIAAALVALLAPIVIRGAGAFVFRGTVEYRRMMLDQFGRGDRPAIQREVAAAFAARAPAYAMLSRFEAELEQGESAWRRRYSGPFRELKKRVSELLGPDPSKPIPLLPRQQYGQTRWDRARVKLDALLYEESWDYSDPTRMGRKVLTPRVEKFRGTSLEPLFDYVAVNLERLMQPRRTLYGGFLVDSSVDAHFFGGIWPELLGTLYLALGAMLFSVPMGILAAVYLVEYAREGRGVALLRTCISTLAGVPSIIFGLFGLAFFINTLHVSDSKSVLAGALSLAVLVLPTVIKASEEAIRAVPQTYKEAAMSLGAGRWRTVATVMLPAALPGILTGVVISLGRAAGETAPIIFTAAVSVGKALRPWEIFSQPTPALSWNIYNLSTEHTAVEEIRHVQFGMVFTLVALVLLLNLLAILLRARVSRKLRG